MTGAGYYRHGNNFRGCRGKHKLMDIVDQHEQNTGKTVDTVIADTQYGTAENFRSCQERGIKSHMGDVLTAQGRKGRREKVFDSKEFIYNAESDTYTCPAGQTLTRRKHKKLRKAYEYACSKAVCLKCPLRSQCTKSRTVRTLKRHYNQEAIDIGRSQSQSAEAFIDRKRRKWLMEGSFADAANNHGFKRARWRRLWRQKIQDYMIAAVQNIRILLKHGVDKPMATIKASNAPFFEAIIERFSAFFAGTGVFSPLNIFLTRLI